MKTKDNQKPTADDGEKRINADFFKEDSNEESGLR